MTPEGSKPTQLLSKQCMHIRQYDDLNDCPGQRYMLPPCPEVSANRQPITGEPTIHSRITLTRPLKPFLDHLPHAGHRPRQTVCQQHPQRTLETGALERPVIPPEVVHRVARLQELLRGKVQRQLGVWGGGDLVDVLAGRDEDVACIGGEDFVGLAVGLSPIIISVGPNLSRGWKDTRARSPLG